MPEINQTVSFPQASVLKSTASLNLFMAGTGSGKTHLAGILAATFVLNFPEARGGIFANTFDQLNTSSLFRIREYWGSIGWTEWSKENPKGYYVSGKEPPADWDKCKRNFDRFTNIISFRSGALIFTGSLENYMSHSGKEMAWCLLDETKDTREEALKEVIITRLRQPAMFIVDGKPSDKGNQDQQWNPLYCLTSPARVEWINELFELDNYVNEITSKIYSKETFFEKEFNNKKVVISSTYHNVHNVGVNYINNILANNSTERGKALVYGNPFSITGGEFYSSFDRLKHVGTVKYIPELPIHISFDQNSVPYNSAGLCQVKRINEKWGEFDWYWEWRFFDEIALVNPRNSTEEVCEEFISRYDRYKPQVYYYGDASGHSRKVTAAKTDFEHHYQMVEFKLGKYLVNGSDRTLFVNPSIPLRRDFMNKMFEGKMPIKFIVDENCHYMINDLMYVKQALDGGKDKHIVEDKETGDKYQKYGHFGDLLEYMAVELFKTYYNG